MKGGSESKVVCETAMEAGHKQNKQKTEKNQEPDRLSKFFDELQPPSPRSKARTGEGSKSLLARLGTTASMKSYSMASFSPDYYSRGRKASSRGYSGPLGHSGPIVSLIPKEAREEKKGSGLETKEPTSPKVSCIGQVKLKTKKARKTKEANNIKNHKGRDRSLWPAKETTAEPGKMSKLTRLFSRKNLTEKPVQAEPRQAAKEGEGNNYPSLGQMKQFSSSRESPALANVYRDSEDVVYKNDEGYASDEEAEANDVNVSPMVDQLQSHDSNCPVKKI